MTTFTFMPKHDVADRSQINHNGAFIPESGVFIKSGSLDGVTGSTTGSVQFSIGTTAFKLRRVEVFHSGAAANFNLKLENSTPNTGSFYDPRNVVVSYVSVPGSVDFSDGIDQVEDMFGLTDNSSGNEGNLYFKFMPYGAGNNSFKYLLFFEATIVYINKDGSYA